MNAAFLKLAEQAREEVTQLASRLVRIPSLSGQEKTLADTLLEIMPGLGFDDCFRDAAGNVVGVVKGSGGGPGVMFNSHMDHVDPGDPGNWEYPPYGGVVDKGFVHGRAASDVKGGMAAQLVGAAVLLRAGARPKGDVLFTGVVQEEPAETFGMRHLCDVGLPERGLTFEVMISSEATALDLYLGHRGRAEIEVVTRGRTSHGSSPWRGINAVYAMLPVVARAQALDAQLPQDDFLGRASLALTNIFASPGQMSITPDVCTIWLDRRLLPRETKEFALSQIQDILDDLARTDPDFKAEARLRAARETSYTGYSQMCDKYMQAWSLSPEHPQVARTKAALAGVGQHPGIGRWDFGTDASYVTGVLGIPTIGYSPMEEHYAHTPKDRCSIDNMVKAVAGNAALAWALAG